MKRLLSTEHFSIDGTLIEAWASMKSFKAKEPPQDDSKSDPDERPATEGRNAEVDFHGEKRSGRWTTMTFASGTIVELCRIRRAGHCVGDLP